MNAREAAPDFDAARDGGGRLRLSDLRGRPVVLFFYPKDDTSGCTAEALGFTARAEEFAALGAAVVGASRDSPAAHDRFIKKHALRVTALVSDPDGAIAAAWGVWVQKSMYGRSYMGVERTTFLIDAEGVIRGVWRKIPASEHAERALTALRDGTCAKDARRT